MSDTVLIVSNLSVAYEDAPALENISFEVQSGDYIAIIGPNGAGKSTLMNAIMGLIAAQKGSRISVDRKRLGYVPQHQAVDWDFPVTVRDVVMMGLIRQIGWLRWPRRLHWQQVAGALERVGMQECAPRQIGELSGGQRQRVFIARALAQQADILLLDEPFAGVDAGAQSDLMTVLDKLHAEGITILLSTHDLSLAFKRFQKVIALNRRLAGIGTPDAMYQPEILRALYGGSVAALRDGEAVLLFVDENVHCC